MQNSWATAINPVLSNPANQSLLLKDVVLAVGDNTINHRLGRKLQGWIVIRKNATADIYDKQSTNQMQELTLILHSSAIATISLEVF